MRGRGWCRGAEGLDLMIKGYDWRGVRSVFALGGALGLGFCVWGTTIDALIPAHKQKGFAWLVPKFFSRLLSV